jgi:hypothetical protein
MRERIRENKFGREKKSFLPLNVKCLSILPFLFIFRYFRLWGFNEICSLRCQERNESKNAKNSNRISQKLQITIKRLDWNYRRGPRAVLNWGCTEGSKNSSSMIDRMPPPSWAARGLYGNPDGLKRSYFRRLSSFLLQIMSNSFHFFSPALNIEFLTVNYSLNLN